MERSFIPFGPDSVLKPGKAASNSLTLSWTSLSAYLQLIAMYGTMYVNQVSLSSCTRTGYISPGHAHNLYRPA